MECHFSDNCLEIVGEFTRHTVPEIDKKQFNRFVGAQVLTVELGKVDKVDTSGLAWLLLLQGEMEKKGHQLQLLNVSPDLLNLATLSGVTSFLPITTNN